jgi:chromosome segregation ATPase
LKKIFRQKSENNTELENIETQISRIQNKLNELLKRHAALQKQNIQQQEIIAGLKKDNEVNEKKIRAMEEQQYILKSAAGNLGDTDKKAFEQIIGKYIKEIDKCIALLSE